MLGVNQGIIMVLAVVVIGGLVGSRRARLRGGAGARPLGQFGLRVCSPRSPYSRSGSRSTGSRRERGGANKQGTMTSVDEEQRTSSACTSNRTAKEGRIRRRWSRRCAGRGARRSRAVSALAVVGERARRRAARTTPRAAPSRWTRTRGPARRRTSTSLKYVLEKKLGCKVKVEKHAPRAQPLFQAMADGKVDVVLEDWKNIDLRSRSTSTSGSVVRLGWNGITGVIGWYIPRYLLKQYPQFKTWQGPEGQGERLQVARSRARRACSSAATRPTCRRTSS